MKQFSIIDRINRRRIFTFVGLIAVVAILFGFLIAKNPKETKAFTFTSTNLTVSNGDILYIGAGGLQSERVWSDYGRWSDTSSGRAASGLDTNYVLGQRYVAPAGHVYGPNEVTNMNYPAGVGEPGGGGCPRIDTDNRMNGGTQIAPGRCKAIITDGGGAIIRINGDITINGRLYLGDRVVLIANNITLGPTGKIIGSGQSGAPADGHDNSAFGGIGAHNGGHSQTPAGSPGSPYFLSTENTPLGFLPNYLGYYNPLTLSDDVGSYFYDSNGQAIIGGGGARGGNGTDASVSPGYPTPVTSRSEGSTGVGELGIGGSGGGGATGSDTSGGDDSGAGGGGGGGYGIVLQAQNITTAEGSVITVKGGDYGSSLETGGLGGPGGGGTVVFRSMGSSILGQIIMDGGAGFSWDGRSVADGGRGTFAQVFLSNPSIQKRLTAQQREGVTPTTNFNPYALQPNDVIKVDIRVSQLTLPATVTDNLLSLGGTISGRYYCRPSDSAGGFATPYSLPTGRVDLPNGKIEWSLTAANREADGVYDFYYYCKVTTR